MMYQLVSDCIDNRTKLWVVYGMGINDFVTLIANSIAVAINTILLILKINYSKDPLN
jgi:uncharacterized protein with PQ loop repeat